MMKALIRAFVTILFAIVFFSAFIFVIEKQLGDISQFSIDKNKQTIEETKKKQAQLKLIQEEKIEQEKIKEQEAIQKERAWDAYYKPPKECDSYESQEEMVECGNHAIRAKREFNALWDSGQIPR